ncbi:hypothetical protein HPB51_010950 [Rhipicephalus microplus]|uniref:Uncharacterized protein n=1 Tax=Rhipicephalus microplus TaxID=6941 RepID=A0A9J6D529_RHIMP|nr:hypothetical protein HPB51_010950 [Rhipicephalus microplus]
MEDRCLDLTLLRRRLSELFEKHEANLIAMFQGTTVSVITDETTDDRSKSVVNVLFVQSARTVNAALQPVLVDVKFVDEVNSSVIGRIVTKTLKRVGNEQKGKYPPELRAFALTLHFYSPAVHEYVRSKLNEALPSQRTLRGWYKSIQGAPGFTAEAFTFLEKFAEARDETFYCALIVDDMAIRKHVELVGDKVVGNPFARSYKAPLRKQNEACWKPFFAYTQAYIKGLRDPAGRPVLEGLKKTGFVGFLICMASTEKMFDELVGQEVTSSSSGNCTKYMVSILNTTTVVAQVDATSALTDMRRSSILEPHDDHDYTHPENLSAVVVAVVPYIAGFVVRQVCKTTTCEECIAALYSDELVPLVEQKNRGGLVSPSKDVIGLCEAVEKGLRRLQIECGTLQAVNSQSKHLVLEVLRLSVEENWFQKLEQHILDLDPLDNHIYSLCKKVAELYVKIRIHHMTKKETARSSRTGSGPFFQE